MALQTIQQILAPDDAVYINGSAAQLRVSPAILLNLYQGLVEKNGKGIDDNFVSAEAAEDSAQIQVHRILPVNINPRQLGSSKNGGAYSQNQHFTQTETVSIKILEVLDDPILIPRYQTDMLPVDLVATNIRIFSNKLATIINGATLASKYFATYTSKARGKAINETVLNLADATGLQIRNQFINANGLLDEGDEDHGIDVFPRDTRVAVVKTSVGPALKTNGVLTLGGANEVYRILKNAGINGDGVRVEDDGYIGDIDGVEVRAISNESLGHGSLFLGLPKGELKASPFLGYIASSYANARGVSTSKQTMIVPEVNGQGSRILPYVKFGVASWYPLGNSMLVSEAVDLFKGLKTIFPSPLADDILFDVKSAGSRLFPTFGTFTVGATGFTIEAEAIDDFNHGNVVGGYYLTSEAAITSVHAFVKAAVTAGYSAGNACTFTTGSCEKTGITVTDAHYVNVLVIATDGSVSLISKQYNA